MVAHLLRPVLSTSNRRSATVSMERKASARAAYALNVVVASAVARVGVAARS